MTESAGSVPKMVNDLLSEKQSIAVFLLYHSEVGLEFFKTQLFFDNSNHGVYACVFVSACVGRWQHV